MNLRIVELTCFVAFLFLIGILALRQNSANRENQKLLAISSSNARFTLTDNYVGSPGPLAHEVKIVEPRQGIVRQEGSLTSRMPMFPSTLSSGTPSSISSAEYSGVVLDQAVVLAGSAPEKKGGKLIPKYDQYERPKMPAQSTLKTTPRSSSRAPAGSRAPAISRTKQGQYKQIRDSAHSPYVPAVPYEPGSIYSNNKKRPEIIYSNSRKRPEIIYSNKKKRQESESEDFHIGRALKHAVKFTLNLPGKLF